jgi:hypothetical protein
MIKLTFQICVIRVVVQIPGIFKIDWCWLKLVVGVEFVVLWYYHGYACVRILLNIKSSYFELVCLYYFKVLFLHDLIEDFFDWNSTCLTTDHHSNCLTLYLWSLSIQTHSDLASCRLNYYQLYSNHL